MLAGMWAARPTLELCELAPLPADQAVMSLS